MLQINNKDFEQIVSQAVERVPEPYRGRLLNVAFLIEDEPSPEQRHKLKLQARDTLFGLYEGVPLPSRGGMTKLLPDKITIFRLPLLSVSADASDLEDKVGRTVWHEVAHYFGLDHRRIGELERKNYNGPQV